MPELTSNLCSDTKARADFKVSMGFNRAHIAGNRVDRAGLQTMFKNLATRVERRKAILRAVAERRGFLGLRTSV